MTETINPLPLSAVEVEDDFWSPRLDTNRLITLKHQYDHIKANGCLDNFRRVIGEAGGEFDGPMFLDANAYKWLEAASYVLATNDIPSISEKVNELVSLIERTQADDGYLYTYFMLAEQQKRWTNFSLMHEMYCAGHLIEAAVAHHRATGEEQLLDVARRFADHINRRFGPGQKEVIPGHQEIELALIRLYRETDELRYLELASCFIDRRGRDPSLLAEELFKLQDLGGTEIYDEVIESTEAARGVFLDESGNYDGSFAQDHLPVREQDTVEGHAVRAAYLYAAVAALLRDTDDSALFDAVQRLWTNMVTKRMYITGGLGSTSKGESFTDDYDLPNDTAYAETCAAIGNVFWSQQMFLLTGEAKYIDVLERALYNGLLVGVSLDGTQFSYSNPLETDGSHGRNDWLYVACCPPNLARVLASLGKYVYAKSEAEKTLFVNLYVGSDVKTTISDQSLHIEQRTNYPWNGEVDFELSLEEQDQFTIKFRIPEWTDRSEIEINGSKVNAEPTNGYIPICRTWSDGDQISITYPMTIDVVAANPNVRDDRAHVALQRGPLVYCVESEDNSSPVDHLILEDPSSLSATHEDSLLGGVTVIEGDATIQNPADWTGNLYRTIDSIRTEQISFTSIPYYAWNNRGRGAMNVWLRFA